MLPYTEVQKFRQPWLIVLLFIFTVLAVWGIIQQLIFGRPFGNDPVPDWVLALISFMLLVALAAFFFMRLETRVDEQGILLRFVPFHFTPKKLSWENIQKIYVRRYRPIGEYGGWGIRRKLFSRSIAYNVSGKYGIQIEMKNGRKILIGTQNPDDVNQALDKLRHKNKINC